MKNLYPAGPISQHKRLAMGLPVNQLSQVTVKGSTKPTKVTKSKKNLAKTEGGY